jgi:hypothetical protein
MTWKFHIVATEERRTFSRILQVLEAQIVCIHSFVGETTEAGVSVTLLFSSEKDKAYRIETLMRRLEAVRSVSVEPGAS